MDEIFALAVFVGCTDSSRGAERGASEELAALTARRRTTKGKKRDTLCGRDRNPKFQRKIPAKRRRRKTESATAVAGPATGAARSSTKAECGASLLHFLVLSRGYNELFSQKL